MSHPEKIFQIDKLLFALITTNYYDVREPSKSNVGTAVKITFEFDGAQGRVFAYGVSKNARDDEEANNISDIRGMNDKLGHGEKSLWWPWYRDFEPPYYDWSISHEPWIEILNAAKKGESPLVNRIIGEVVRIAEVLEQMKFDDNDVPITQTQGQVLQSCKELLGANLQLSSLEAWGKYRDMR